MSAAQIVFVLWIVFGVLFAWAIDRWEMHRDVPFGDMPAILDTQTIRRVMCAFCILFGPPLALTGFAIAIYELITEHGSEDE